MAGPFKRARHPPPLGLSGLIGVTCSPPTLSPLCPFAKSSKRKNQIGQYCGHAARGGCGRRRRDPAVAGDGGGKAGDSGVVALVAGSGWVGGGVPGVGG
jgi:hypothetical protein